MKKQTIQMLGACITGAVLTFIGMGAFILLQPESSSREDDEYCGTQFVSRGISYHYDGNKGYISNLDGKKTLKGVSWISKPLGDDSLVCFSDGEKRGYFNMFTGELAIKPKYRHAWVFSDGLAAVEVDNRILFIDQTGKVVIDNDIPYKPRHNGYVFHHGYCVVHDKQGEKVGMIDKKGNWAVKPEYLSIELKMNSFWVLRKNQQTAAVLSSNLDMVVPFTEAKFFVDNGLIEAHMSDHTVRTYSPSGELLDDFHISEVTQLLYDTNEVYYDTTKDYNYREIDYEERMVSESEQEQLSVRQAVARCRCYQAEYGWYGLMTPDGRVVTPPSYSSITAIGPDLYFCKYSESQGVILDGKGQRVR